MRTECRRARVWEFPFAAALRQEMALEMGGDYDAMAAGWREKFCEFFAGKQQQGSAQLFLAFDGTDAIGCAAISISEDYRRFAFNLTTAHVNAVFVRLPYRRRGIARELMLMALAWAREKGCMRVRLRSSDEGRPLYEALGFEPGREMELRF